MTYEITPEQAPRIYQLLTVREGVHQWHAIGFPKDGEEGPVWYGSGDRLFNTDPRAQEKPTRLITDINEFVVIIYKEVFRKTLPALMRPGVQISDELREAYLQDFCKAADYVDNLHQKKVSRFDIEPNKDKPWLYDGVVYILSKSIPLKHYAKEHLFECSITSQPSPERTSRGR